MTQNICQHTELRYKLFLWGKRFLPQTAPHQNRYKEQEQNSHTNKSFLKFQNFKELPKQLIKRQ